MSRSGWLFTIGLVASLLGLLVVGGSLMPNHVTVNMTIARGDYAVIDTPIVWKGEISGYYRAGVGAEVKAYVFSSQQYEEYASGSMDGYLSSNLTPQSPVTLPGIDKFYIVFENENVSGTLPSTEVYVSYTLRGIAVFYLAAGICTVTGALAVIILAFKKRKGEGVVSPPDSMANAQSQEVWTKRSPQR